MIQTKKLRTLTLDRPTRKNRISAIAAASGLVNVKSFLYVIADDENHLGVFHLNGRAHGTTIRLFPGSLPHSNKDRKKQKPDLEILTHLAPKLYPPHGALLAIPSGSKANRWRGAMIPLGKNGEIRGNIEVLDFRSAFEKIRSIVPEVNLEAVVVRGKSFWLFHRGHQSAPLNQIVEIPVVQLLKAVCKGKKLKRRHITLGAQFQIPALAGLYYTITDATAVDDKHIIFTAAAEATSDSVQDGPHGGSVIGIVDNDAKVKFLDSVAPKRKLEGVCIVGSKGARKLLLVNDEDHPDIASELRGAELPIGFILQ